MKVIRRVSIESDDLAPKAVTRPKMSFIVQAGSAKPGTVNYGTPFKAGEPIPVMTTMTAGATEPSISSVGTAGFTFAGSAGGYYTYIAAGSA